MYTNFWNLRVSDRLSQWKDIRHTLSDLSLTDAVAELNQLWSTAPFIGYYLPPDNPAEWPDPWTLLAENYYCDVAKSLGMLYTIYFTSHKSVPMELRVYYDFKEKNRYNVVWIDSGKYILNYWPYEIVNTKQIEETELQLLYSYSTEDLQLDKY